jgi:hypothetical protein
LDAVIDRVDVWSRRPVRALVDVLLVMAAASAGLLVLRVVPALFAEAVGLR